MATTKAQMKAYRARTATSSGGSSSTAGQVGLNKTQVSQLRGLSGIDQKALSAYEDSGSVVGAKNNPRGRGRENTAITPDSMQKVDVAEIPQKTVPTNPAVDLAYNNTTLQSDYTKLMNGMLTPVDPNSSEGVQAAQQSGNNLMGLQSYLAEVTRQDPLANQNIAREAINDKALRRAQQEENMYSEQINTIQANAQAAQLKLEGQGRGITDTIIGGQQARINREAAIAALPVQAQLAAAQGRVEIAQKHVDMLFQAKVADLNADTQWKNNLAQSMMSVATATQSNILQAKMNEISMANQKAQANLAYSRDLQSQAINNGQGNLLTSLTSIDPKSPTFEQDIAKFASQLSKPVAAGSPKAPTLQNFGTSDAPNWKEYNYSTGQWESIAGVGGGTSTTSPEVAQKSLDQLSFLRNTAQEAIDLAGEQGIINTPVGPSFITRVMGDTFVGNTSFRNLQSKTDTLKTNVLSLMTDPNVKKFFGPQMSNADVRLMSSTGSTLNNETQSPKEYIAEVKRLDDLFNRMQTAVNSGLNNQSYGTNVITAPDGTLIELID